MENQAIREREMKEKIIAYEWHNEETGHCYVDYIAHSSMDEVNGYKKTPLYKGEDINFAIGHGLDRLINQEVERRIKERMENEINEFAIYVDLLKADADKMPNKHNQYQCGAQMAYSHCWFTFSRMLEKFRSCLTKDGTESSQKTEKK